MKSLYPLRLAFLICIIDIKIKRRKKALKKHLKKHKILSDERTVFLSRCMEDLYSKRREQEDRFKSLL